MAVEEQLEEARASVERKIKMCLLEKSMTQNELASLLNVSKARISKAVNGGTNPSDIVLRKKIYQVLGMK
ncbi:MAG: helix-turn-helix domain-containing protein [Lactobacillus sp.]